jgi:hypothetical protein
MSKVLLGWPNRIDAATLSGGSWSTDLPLTNLQARSLAVVARSADDANASTKFIVDHGAATSQRVFGIFNHNLSEAARIKVSLGSTSGGAEVYAGAWTDCFPITFGTGADEWAGYDWWEPMASDDYVGNPFPVIVALSSSYSARYTLIELDDTANTQGFVQIGRAFVGGAFAPGYNAVHGLEDGLDDRSELIEMESGGVVPIVRRRRRTVRFQLPALRQSDEFSILHEIKRRAGLTGEVLYVPSAKSAAEIQRTAMLARFKSLNQIAYPSVDWRDASIELVELI